MAITEKIYNILPPFAQNIALAGFGYTWHKRRFGGIFSEELIKFKDRENFSKQNWLDYQTIELRKLLIHAFNTVPLYAEKYKKSGFTLSDFEKFELDDLQKLPFLEKEELRKFGTSTLLSSKAEKNGQFFTSSGSTGTPVKILFSLAMHQRWSAAFEARIRHWAGVTRFDSRGMIGGRKVLGTRHTPPFYRYNAIEKQVYFSIYHLSKQNARNYYQAIQKYNLDYMTGYAISNGVLASFINEMNWEPLPLKAVITSSEKLTQTMRDNFAKAYSCKTFDSYGSIEACSLISETKNGDFLASPDVGIIEIINSDFSKTNLAEPGEIISTGFLNYDQPLIRFRVGDMAILKQEWGHSNGLEMPIYSEIIGRTDDVLTFGDGRTIASFNRFFADLSAIRETQVIQTELNTLLIKLVRTSEYNSLTEKALLSSIQSRLGDSVKVNLEYVEEIPRNNNGKFKAVTSLLPKK